MIEGGVTSAEGFEAAGGAAGIKKNGSADMALIYCKKPCIVAGTFTSNQVKACEKNCDCTSNSCCCSVSRGVTASVSTQALAVAEQLLVVRNPPVGKCIAHNGQERH